MSLPPHRPIADHAAAPDAETSTLDELWRAFDRASAQFQADLEQLTAASSGPGRAEPPAAQPAERPPQA